MLLPRHRLHISEAHRLKLSLVKGRSVLYVMGLVSVSLSPGQNAAIKDRVRGRNSYGQSTRGTVAARYQ